MSAKDEMKAAEKEAKKAEKAARKRLKKYEKDLKKGKYQVEVTIDHEQLRRDIAEFSEEIRQSVQREIDASLKQRGDKILDDYEKRTNAELVKTLNAERSNYLTHVSKDAQKATEQAKKAVETAKKAKDEKLIKKAEEEYKKAQEIAKKAEELAKIKADDFRIANDCKQQAIALKDEAAALASETAQTNADATVALRKAEEKLKQERLDKLNENADVAFEVIGRFEGIKLKASIDPKAGGYDIAFGNRSKPDGSPVQAGDEVSSVEELRWYYDSFCEKEIYPQMTKYLHVEKMTPEQIVAIQSLMYNAGQYVLQINPGFVKDFNNYLDTGDKQALENVEKFLEEKIYAKNPKTKQREVVTALIARRDFEKRLIEGGISLTDPTNENYIDIANQSIGSVYVLSSKKEDVVRDNVSHTTDSRLCKIMGECKGDTLQVAMQKRMAEVQQQRVSYTRTKTRRG